MNYSGSFKYVEDKWGGEHITRALSESVPEWRDLVKGDNDLAKVECLGYIFLTPPH